MGAWGSATRRVSAVYFALALGGILGALWVAHRFHLGAAATAASLLPTLAPLFLSWVTFRSGAERADEQPLEEIAEHLAQAVRNQWETEVQVRRVNDPYPMTVRWRAAPDDLVESWPLLQATAGDWPGELGSVPEEWANSPAELEGSGAEITRVFAGRIPTQRLLVLGGPGAGKTVLLSRAGVGAASPTDDERCRPAHQCRSSAVSAGDVESHTTGSLRLDGGAARLGLSHPG